MQNFIFGGDDMPKTPQELARLRSVAQALAPSRTPQNVGEGIASIGNALVYRALMGKADKAQKAGADAASNRFNAIVKALNGGAAAPAAASGGMTQGMASPTAEQSMASVGPTNDPVADVLAAGSGGGAAADAPWLKYANQGATRSQPLDPKLVGALGFLPDLGVSMEVFSGGQPAAGQGPRTGSVRHDHGGAADAFFYKDGRRLDWSNPADLPIFEEIVKRGKAAGITGFGAGDGYMQPGSMHLGFGNPAVWGAGGKGENAPEWLRNAYAGAAETPPAMAAQPGMTATASPALGYAPQQPVEVASLSPEMPDMSLRKGGDAPPATTAAMGQQNALRALAGLPVASGGGQAAAPAAQVAQAAPMGGGFDLNAAIEAANDPYLPEGKRAVLQELVRQQLEQQQAQREMEMKRNDPAYQTALEKSRLELERMKNPAPQAKPADVQEYEYAKSQGYDGSFLDFQLAQKKAGATTTTINTGEGDKFYDKLDQKNAETFATLSDGGIQAKTKIGQIDRLESLMKNAPQGAVGAMKQAAGEWGIATEGLSDIQAASALLEKMVPEQRAPGSGPMSDADIKMFRASLPRVLNQPGGNQLIFQTMRGIAEYEMQMGDIADRVANREITPAEGRRLIRELKNPLASYKPPSDGPTPNEGWGELPGGIKFRKKGE